MNKEKQLYEAAKETKGFIISDPGDDSVGILSSNYELHGPFIFEDNEALINFVNDLKHLFNKHCTDTSHIKTFEQSELEEKQFLSTYEQSPEPVNQVKWPDELITIISAMVYLKFNNEINLSLADCDKITKFIIEKCLPQQSLSLNIEMVDTLPESSMVVDKLLSELPSVNPPQQNEQLKEKAQKWDDLGQMIAKCYNGMTESGKELPPIKENADFYDIGEMAAIAFGYADGTYLISKPEQAVKSEWITVKDRVPDNINPVLISINKGDILVGKIFKRTFEEDVWLNGDNEKIFTPTHWMSLPKQPTKEK
jgi:hypothetical protein